MRLHPPVYRLAFAGLVVSVCLLQACGSSVSGDVGSLNTNDASRTAVKAGNRSTTTNGNSAAPTRPASGNDATGAAGNAAAPASDPPSPATNASPAPAATPPASTSPAAPPNGVFGIKVSGDHFVSTMDGSTVQIIGANVSGLETGYKSRFPAFRNAGVEFWGQMADYGNLNINTVRLPLNEASWLNYTCYDSGTGDSGNFYAAASGGGYQPDPNAEYQATVKQAVADATGAGLYVILDLHWGAPKNSAGQSLCPIGQPAYADADHAITFWQQIADTFKDNPAVMFELFNEPFGSNVYNSGVVQNGSTYTPGPDALELTTGGTFSTYIEQNNTDGSMHATNMAWNVANMITLLQTIRNEGATNVVLASPIGWAGELETWLGTYDQTGNPDPIGQFGAAWHAYGYSKGTSAPNAVLSAGFPIVITETYGFNSALDGGKDAGGYTWAASKGIGYLCWGVVNDWSGNGLSLSATPPWASCPQP